MQRPAARFIFASVNSLHKSQTRLPGISWASRFVFILALTATFPAKAQTAESEKNKSAATRPIAVDVINKSVPTPCAETDNIQIDFQADSIRSFQIEAVHPAYIGTIVKEEPGADFTACDMSKDPRFAAKPRKKTFWETPSFWLTGFTYPSFWRPNNVPIRIGNKVEKGFHLIQLWMWYRERAEEVLVLYPPDGYWRARPLPFANLRWTAYGSSFLVGPVEMKGRPIVRFKEIVFDPKDRSFTMHFVRGGSAKLSINSITQKKIALKVNFSGQLSKKLPFASLRSMYVTRTNADVAEVAWRALNGHPSANGSKPAGWRESPVMAFTRARTSKFWAGRQVPSTHNLSAPDFVFSAFAAGKSAK